MLGSIRKNAITLSVFAIVTTGLTAVVHLITEPTLSRQVIMQKKKLLDQVIPREIYNNLIEQDCYSVFDKTLGSDKPHKLYVARQDQKPVAVAIETIAPDGYAGVIQLLVGVDFSGTVLGVRVVQHNETPGLGDKIETRRSEWITHFKGKNIGNPHDHRFAVKKDGGDFDQFTGATITPRAVVNATQRAARFAETLPLKMNALPRCGTSHD